MRSSFGVQCRSSCESGAWRHLNVAYREGSLTSFVNEGHLGLRCFPPCSLTKDVSVSGIEYYKTVSAVLVNVVSKFEFACRQQAATSDRICQVNNLM